MKFTPEEYVYAAFKSIEEIDQNVKLTTNGQECLQCIQEAFLGGNKPHLSHVNKLKEAMRSTLNESTYFTYKNRPLSRALHAIAMAAYSVIFLVDIPNRSERCEDFALSSIRGAVMALYGDVDQTTVEFLTQIRLTKHLLSEDEAALYKLLYN